MVRKAAVGVDHIVQYLWDKCYLSILSWGVAALCCVSWCILLKSDSCPTLLPRHLCIQDYPASYSFPSPSPLHPVCTCCPGFYLGGA